MSCNILTEKIYFSAWRIFNNLFQFTEDLDNLFQCNENLNIKQGWIYRGIAQGCAPLFALVNRSARGGGGAIKSNSEIWHSFQGFSFFKSIIKCLILSKYWCQKRALLGHYMLPLKILIIRCPRLTKNAFAIRHLLQTSFYIVYIFTCKMDAHIIAFIRFMKTYLQYR
jgi:hypothetical protein